MFGLGMAEVVVILFIGMLLFGSQLPNVARSLGKSISAFRHEASALTNDLTGSGDPRR
jgi:sec-independent protein translocase protein TatA